MNAMCIVNTVCLTLLGTGCFVACSVVDEHQTGLRCQTSADCDSGGCYRGFCVSDLTTCEDGVSEPCFDGDPELLEGEKRCRAGVRDCVDGQPTECLGQVLPDEESCNSVDDDCDGITDELVAATCTTGLPGVCAGGVVTCSAGRASCEPKASSGKEVCNAADDDCDSVVDEDATEPCYPQESSGCTFDEERGFTCVGLCQTGVASCVGGLLGACQGAVVAAPEDGCSQEGLAQDDDCDGQVDEDCVCELDTTQDCYLGPAGTANNPPCKVGTQTCAMAAGGPRFGACEGSEVPTQETCADANVDNNCDGILDNIDGLGQVCTVAQRKGQCGVGAMDCVGSALSCVTGSAEVERCDTVDNDCDGAVDETFDLASDPMRCGACDIVCEAGEVCCSGRCIDAQRSEDHCGACGQACGEGLRCCGGACVSTDGSGEHCGACGNACVGGTTCCGGRCVNLDNASGNCGVCDRACGEGQACCDGACQLPGTEACTGCAQSCAGTNDTCCGGACTDTGSDESHCGSCGNVCEVGQVCCGGKCVEQSPSQCGDSCASCGTKLCCQGECVAQSTSHCGGCGVACQPGDSCCGSGCANVEADEDNCGSCGVACDSGEFCDRGHCCPAGQHWCALSQSCARLCLL